MSTLFYTFYISLFDSLSTTLQIVVFILLLTTAKPLRNSLSYLAGLSLAYFACGLVGYLALDQLRVMLAPLLASHAAIPNPVYYQAEFLMGVIMALIGVWYYFRKKKTKKGRAENWFFSKLRTMNGLFAFGLGVFISVTSFPMSIPYFVALGRYSALHLDLFGVVGFILLYNLGYDLPMVLVLGLYLALRRGTEDDHDALHEKARMLNVHLTAWTLVGFGLFSMLDAGWFFMFGQAMMRDRYF